MINLPNKHFSARRKSLDRFFGMQSEFDYFQKDIQMTTFRFILETQTPIETVRLESFSDFILNTFFVVVKALGHFYENQINSF